MIIDKPMAPPKPRPHKVRDLTNVLRHIFLSLDAKIQWLQKTHSDDDTQQLQTDAIVGLYATVCQLQQLVAEVSVAAAQSKTDPSEQQMMDALGKAADSMRDMQSSVSLMG